jgi:hypothetical protein
VKFELNKPVEMETPTVDVDPLPRGQHRFRLVVKDKKERSSPPVEFIVTVG